MVIKQIDLGFLGQSNTHSVFLINSSEGPILIESGPYSTYENLKDEVQKLGFSIEDIKHVFVTHIHLDHAGAAWALARHGATIYVHPVGAPHLADPSKLWQSASKIYGNDMERLWKTIEPIPEEQIEILNDQRDVYIGDVHIKAWHTPGHAAHHIAYQVGDKLFAGDAAGVCIKNGFVQPACPPPETHIDTWKGTIELMKTLPVHCIYLTHFGEVENWQNHLDDLKLILDEWGQWAKEKYDQGHDPASCTESFKEYYQNQLKAFGHTVDEVDRYEAANPSFMNIWGLMRYWRKKHEENK